MSAPGAPMAEWIEREARRIRAERRAQGAVRILQCAAFLFLCYVVFVLLR